MVEPANERVVTIEIRAVDADGNVDLWSTANFAVRGLRSETVKEQILNAVDALESGEEGVVVLRLPDRALMPGRSLVMSELSHAYGATQTPSYKLMRALEVARAEWAQEEGRTPRSILNTSVLRNIANVMPKNRDELNAIHGIGQLTVSKYGERILAIVASHLPSLETADENYDVDN